LLTVAAGLLATSASAQLQSYGPIDASFAGWYSEAGESSTNQGLSPSYRAGNYDAITYRNYFVFDRSGLTGAHIEKATLDIFLPGADFGATYFSADPADVGAIFSLYKFDGSMSALVSGSNPLSSYADLAPNGSLFGNITVSESSNAGVLLSLELNPFFLSYLNSVAGEFVLAGSLSNADASPVSDELMFLNSENAQAPQLRLEFVAVPEPSTYGLIGAGMLGLLVWRRRAVKAARKN
jgi:hypothetical protein